MRNSVDDPCAAWLKAVGTWIRWTREGKKLTQEELAERAGVHVRHVQKIETGERPDVHLSTLYRLAEAMSLHPTELVQVDVRRRRRAKAA